MTHNQHPVLKSIVHSLGWMGQIVMLVVLLLGFPQSGNAQHTVDSLRQQIRTLEKEYPQSYPQDTSYIKTVNQLGEELRFYTADSLFYLAQKALKLSKAVDYKREECKAMYNLGNYYSDQGSYLESISHYQVAMELAMELESPALILDAQNAMGSAYSFLGNYAKAIEEYLSAIKYASEVDDKQMLSILNENIANLYAEQKEYNQALAFYKKTLAINEQIGSEAINAETMATLAAVYAEMGSFEYAMFNINKSIATFEKNGTIDWLAYAYQVKGSIYVKQNKYKWALYWFEQSESLYTDIEDERSRIGQLNGMAQAYLGLDKIDMAEKKAYDALEIARSISSLEGEKECAETIYKIKKAKGEFNEALKYHERFQGLAQSLSKDENRRSLTLLQTQLDYEQKEAELMRQNEASLAKQRRYFYIGIGLIVIFSAIIFFMRRYSALQKRLNKRLQVKHDVLMKREAELLTTNKTKDKLFSIVGHDLKGPVGALQSLMDMMTSGDVGQEEFKGMLPRLKEDVDHLMFTLNNILSWGNTQLKGVITKPSAVQLLPLIKDNVKLLSKIAISKQITIHNEVPNTAFVWADKDQMSLIIRNLISNAVKFTPPGGRITISGLERSDCWQICVADTGIGIDQITKQKMFSKDYRNSTHGTNNEKGTGLGLSLCHEMVVNNKGRIWVESTLRRGSKFYFTVPKFTNSNPQKLIAADPNVTQRVPVQR